MTLDNDLVKRARWKVDLRIFPVAMMLYTFSYLDRVNLSNVHNALIEDLGLHEWQYSTAVSVFFITYILCEIPCNMILQRVNPSMWLSFLGFSFGLISTCTIFVTSFAGLCVLRVFLGVAESGFFPGVVFFLSLWYPRHERAFRISLFFMGAAVAGAIGGLLSFGVLQIETAWNLKGWQWLFIVEGIPSMVISAFFLFLVPDCPETALFLSPEERNALVMRLDSVQDAKVAVADEDDLDMAASLASSPHYSGLRVVWRTISDPIILVLACCFFFTLIGTYSVGYYLPAIIGEMGFDDFISNLITTPIYVISALVILASSYNSDRLHERGIHVAGLGFGSCIGFLFVTLGAHFALTPLSLVGITLANAGVMSAIPIILSWLGDTVSSEHASFAIATAFVVSFGNIGGIVGPQIYGLSVTEDANGEPSYIYGHAAVTVVCFLLTLFACILTLHLAHTRRAESVEYILPADETDPLINSNGL